MSRHPKPGAVAGAQWSLVCSGDGDRLDLAIQNTLGVKLHSGFGRNPDSNAASEVGRNIELATLSEQSAVAGELACVSLRLISSAHVEVAAQLANPAYAYARSVGIRVAVVGDVSWVCRVIRIGEVLNAFGGEPLVGDVCRDSEGVMGAQFVRQRRRNKELFQIDAAARCAEQRNRGGIRGIQPAIAVERNSNGEVRAKEVAVAQLRQKEVLYTARVVGAVHVRIAWRQLVSNDGAGTNRTKQRQPEIETVAHEGKSGGIGGRGKAVSGESHAGSAAALLLGAIAGEEIAVCGDR